MKGCVLRNMYKTMFLKEVGKGVQRIMGFTIQLYWVSFVYGKIISKHV